MTLGELKERISHYGDRYDDLEVCIPNNKGGMGGMSVTAVKGANRGIDWDGGKFILWPETEMVERTKDDIIDEEKLNEDAKKHAENYNKLFPPKHPNLSDDEFRIYCLQCQNSPQKVPYGLFAEQVGNIC